MPRPKNYIRPVRVNTTLPEDLMLQIRIYLRKKHKGLVKAGHFQQFLIERIRKFFAKDED